MTQSSIHAEGTIQWDAMPSETGHIETGINNAWQGPEIWMWHERFVCPGPDGWRLWLHVLFEQDRTSWWQRRWEEYEYIFYHDDLVLAEAKARTEW